MKGQIKLSKLKYLFCMFKKHNFNKRFSLFVENLLNNLAIFKNMSILSD